MKKTPVPVIGLVVLGVVAVATTWSWFWDDSAGAGLSAAAKDGLAVDLSQIPEGCLVYQLRARDGNCLIQHPPSGRALKNELWVPVDTNVLVDLTADDKPHRLSIPAIGVERLVIADRHRIWFRSTKVGRYEIYLQRVGSGEIQTVASLHVVTRDVYDRRFE